MNFEDDEEVNLGIEDEDEAKEAKKRVLGQSASKVTFESDDEDDEDEVDPFKSASAKVQIFNSAIGKLAAKV